MATNAPTGDGHRNGAVRKRTQLKTKVRKSYDQDLPADRFAALRFRLWFLKKLPDRARHCKGGFRPGSAQCPLWDKRARSTELLAMSHRS